MTDYELTDTQQLLLSAASRREDLLITPPETVKGGALKAIVTKLLRHGPVEEVAAVASGVHWREEAGARIALRREGISERSVHMTITLAFLSPDLVKAALEGRLARGAGATTFFDLPTSWQEQESALEPNSA